MTVSELIKDLQEMPQDAEVVTARDPDGAWSLVKTTEKKRYRDMMVCVIVEGT